MSAVTRRKLGAALLESGVVMVSNAVAPDQLGGLQRYVRELAGAVTKQGVPVTIVAKSPGPDAPSRERFSDGVRIRRFPVPERTSPTYALRYPIASLWSVRRIIDGLPGLLHVHYPLQGLPVALGDRPYVHTFHAPVYRELLPERSYQLPPSLHSPMIAAARRAEAVVARRAGATVVLSEYMRGELSLLAPESAHSAQLIPAGLDTDFFCPGAPTQDPLATRPGPLLFTARRMVPRTGVLELIEAMAAIVARIPDAKLAIAGDGRLRTAAEALIGSLSLQDSVFLLGRVSDEELRGWYRAASLFVLPTQELEGFGLSTVEALACGTPAVGTPAGGTPEVLGSLDPRLVAAGVAPADLAAVVLAVLGDEQLLGRVRSQARGHVTPAMSWSAIADQHLETYERVTAMKPQRSRVPRELLPRSRWING